MTITHRDIAIFKSAPVVLEKLLEAEVLDSEDISFTNNQNGSRSILPTRMVILPSTSYNSAVAMSTVLNSSLVLGLAYPEGENRGLGFSFNGDGSNTEFGAGITIPTALEGYTEENILNYVQCQATSVETANGKQSGIIFSTHEQAFEAIINSDIDAWTRQAELLRNMLLPEGKWHDVISPDNEKGILKKQALTHIPSRIHPAIIQITMTTIGVAYRALKNIEDQKGFALESRNDGSQVFEEVVGEVGVLNKIREQDAKRGILAEDDVVPSKRDWFKPKPKNTMTGGGIVPRGTLPSQMFDSRGK